MRRRTLIVMVKEPRPGRVKTRLGQDIGMVSAAWWYRHQVAGLLRRLRDPRWDIALSVAPDTACHGAYWPGDLARMPQGTGDLGRRMRRALSAFSGPVVLIGSDIPGVERRLIAEAFAKLGTAKSVIGPAEDGGFWLVGLVNGAAAPTSMFEGARWSHADTLKDVLPTLPHPVAFAASLKDVDTATDLQAGRK